MIGYVLHKRIYVWQHDSDQEKE